MTEPEPEKTERITGRALQEIRRRIFSRDPLCRRCLEKKPPRITASTQVDHKKPLFLGGEETDENREGLCEECHKDKTREDLGQKPRPEIGFDGWPK